MELLQLALKHRRLHTAGRSGKFLKFVELLHVRDGLCGEL
jgi:hypothetical protein